MDCTAAYREALMRDFEAKASPTRAPGQRRAAETGHEGAAGRPLRRGTDPEQRDTKTRAAAASDA